MSADQIIIDVKHGKDVHTLKLPSTATVKDLKTELAKLTRVPPPLQKLTGKPALGKEGANDMTLVDAGLKPGPTSGTNKLMLIGTPLEAAPPAETSGAAVGAAGAAKLKTTEALKLFPVPFWRLASVAGVLADNFVEGRGQGLEGATLQEAFAVVDILLFRVNPSGLHSAGILQQLARDEDDVADALNLGPQHPLVRLSTRDRASMSRVHATFRKAAAFCEEASKAVKHDAVVEVVDATIAAIRGASRGEWAILPFGFVGMRSRASMLLLVTPVADGVFRAVLINRGEGASDYHPGITSDERKVKYSAFLDLGSTIPEAKITDKAWWLLALGQWMRSNDPQVVSEYCRVEVIYEVLLPWLVGTGPGSTGVNQLTERVYAATTVAGDAAFATPIRSESSAVKGVLSALSFLLSVQGVSRETVKAVKFAIRYEAFFRAASELVLRARSWLSSAQLPLPSGSPVPPRDSLSPDATRKLTKAVAALTGCGPDPTQATLTLEGALFANFGARDAVKNAGGATLPAAYFQNRVVAVYFSGSWCTYCKQVTPLLKEAYETLRRGGRGAMFEVIFISADRDANEYATHVKDMDWPRMTYPPTEAILKAFDVSGVPKLFLFGPDGVLMTSEGVQALRDDPEVERFPFAPWNGAKPITDTDARLLSLGVEEVAYHAQRRFSANSLSLDSLLAIESLASATLQVVRAMPRRPAGTQATVFGKASASGTINADDAEVAAQLVQELKQTRSLEDVAMSDLGLLTNQSVDHYLGKNFDSALPPLGDAKALSVVPRSLKQLDTLLATAVQTIQIMWGRARNANTASRVAVQCAIMETIGSLFLRTIPIPTLLADDWYTTDAFVPATERVAAVGSEAPAAGDMQLEMLARIHSLALSFTTAWQAVDVPTRPSDSERCLTASAMLCVFDAISRNANGAVGGATLSFILSEGRYHISNSMCRNSRAFEEVAATMELVRPALLRTRAAVIVYLRRVKERFPNEIFDLRMVDKFEIRKHSNTVAFLKAYMEACGYQISERPQPGGMAMPPQSEMEQLMTWLCDTRAKLHREHPEFTHVRDMALLVKFLATMDTRDSQLLRQKKETDEWAQWRITFDEDTPGRHMSAGWRTRPEPPLWELLMVRGRDMDIADITAKGFGDRELLLGEGLVVSSPADVAAMLNLERPTEDDILHSKALPSFGEILNDEESAHLLSCLTVNYLRIPLVLDFFSSQDRHTYLFSDTLQRLLRAVLFEPGPYVDPSEVDRFNATVEGSSSSDAVLNGLFAPLRLSAAQAQERQIARLRTGDPHKANSIQLADTTALLGTPNGALLNELSQHRPQSVLTPLTFLLNTIRELGPSSVYSSNASYALFVTSIVCDVLSFVRYARTKMPNVKALSALVEGENRLIELLEELVVPLLDMWSKESRETDDTPTQCVVHSYRAILLRAMHPHGALQVLAAERASGGPVVLGAIQRARLVQHVSAFLGSCAFVRVRHGFGMGLQRTQLAMQQGDAALTPEQKLLRFLQAQGLDTSRVRMDQLEQGRRLMLAGGRRRAIFIQIRSRHYSDTVRVPNLIYADPGSTADSKALKLPPVDVPEARLFSILQEDAPALAALFEHLTSDEVSSVMNAVASIVLRDRSKKDPESQSASDADDAAETAAVERQAEMDPVAGDLWKLEAKHGQGVYAAATSGLLFHLPSAELFWRRNELRPVPDSMSRFPDYETVVGKDVLQCGLVARHEHRHWVHVVGTPFDLCEWDAPHRFDQGVHAPITSSHGSACATCGVIAGGCWSCEQCHSVICGHLPPFCRTCRRRKPEDAEKEEEPIEECSFNGTLYNRPYRIDDEAPWAVKHERWVVNMAKKVYSAAYPMPGEMKFPLLMPERPIAPDADGCLLIANDSVQYDEDKERATWKVIKVTRRPHETVSVYNIVPHARKAFVVLVYCSSSRLALHSLAPILKPRNSDAMPLLLHHAGEIKKRIQNEATLEIHRHNPILGGRETFVPSRLLQGLLPSSILEHFTLWIGADDVIRGEGPEADDPWYGFSLEVRLPRDPHGHAVVIRRAHGAPLLPVNAVKALEHRRRLQELGPGASDAVLNLMARQGSDAGLLTRNSSSRRFGESGRASQRLVREEDVALVASVFPQLPLAVCKLALQSCPRGTGYSGAVDWLTSDRNAARVREAIEQANAAAGGNSSPGARAAHAEAASASMIARQSSSLRLVDDETLIAGGIVDEAAVTTGMGESQHSDSPQRMARSGSISFNSSAPATAEYALSPASAPSLALMNLAGSARLRALATFLTQRFDDASHILAWVALPPTDPLPPTAAPTVMAEREAKAAERLLRAETIGPLDLAVIELPRLRLRLVPQPGPGGVVRLHLEDNPAWWIDVNDDAANAAAAHDSDAEAPSIAAGTDADPLRAAVAALASPLPQHALLRNAAGETQVLVPNHEFRCIAVAGDPLSTLLSFDRSSLMWQETVASPFYLYAAHASGAFLAPPSLASTLYLVALLTAQRHYALAMRHAEACHVDTPFTAEERLMYGLIDRTLDSNCPNNEPDAHAVRLRLAHCVLNSPNKPPFELHVEMAKYLSKETRVTQECRLSTEEMLDLLKRCSVGHAIIKSRLGVLQAAARQLHRTTLKRPPTLTAGQPWARLLSLPAHVAEATSKLSRIHYQEPKKPLKDAELVRFVWEDDLLMDEDGGSNRQLGFFFLYQLLRRKMPVTIKGTDVTSSFAELLARYYQLKSARWGREAQAAGETEANATFASTALAAMICNPAEHWPDLNDRMAMGLLHKGVTISSNEARDTLLPQVWREIESATRNTYRGFVMGVVRSQALDACALASRMHETHVAPRADGSVLITPIMWDAEGRVVPTDTACESVTVQVQDADTAALQCNCPLGHISDAHVAEVPRRAAQVVPAGTSVLPFPHLGEHSSAQTPVGRDMLQRLEGDMRRYIDMKAAKATFTLSSALTGESHDDALAAIAANAYGRETEALREQCNAIIAALNAVRAQEATFIREKSSAALKIANGVWVEGACLSASDGNFDTEKQRKRATATPELLKLHLARLARTWDAQAYPQMSLEWLCGACLSSELERDLKRVNPYHGDLQQLRNAVFGIMLASVRLHFAQQSLQAARSVLACIAVFRSQQQVPDGDTPATASDPAALTLRRNRLELTVTQLVTLLTSRRYFATQVVDGAHVQFDPRFLAFEFIFSLLLRERQVEMVRWFVDNVRRGESRVQQMLMGQGKTTVVGPLLALILSTRNSLVTQVMPTALLEQSRAILRKCFSVVIPKQVFTLTFDRSADEGDAAATELLVQKLEAAERRRAIVVAPPEAVKALLLKIIEQFHTIEDATSTTKDAEHQVSMLDDLTALSDNSTLGPRAREAAEAMRKKLISRSSMADALAPILKLWNRGVLIMDEVDVLLHPLRSELNFPIGHKQPIDCSGPRWLLPMYLLDAVYYCAAKVSLASGRASQRPDKIGSAPSVVAGRLPSTLEEQIPRAELRDAAVQALAGIEEALTLGFNAKALQREPHVALLDPAFYESVLAPALVKWLLPWYVSQLEVLLRLKQPLEADQVAQLHQLVGSVLLTSGSLEGFADAVNGRFPSFFVQLLLLGRDWITTLCPHVISKINRVGFGLLQPADIQMLSAKMIEPTDDDALLKGMPVSRRLLAVPFVAKDVPSRSSEFAHPDVVIGLTILASRYEGLRLSDVKALLVQLKQDYSRQNGRRELRPAAVTYSRWMELAASARSVAGNAASNSTAFVPLGQLQVLDPVQLKEMHALLKDIPEVVHYNLCQHSFPRTMAFQQLKISACGHELGSSILFPRRIGFSGTPSNLLPLDLGDCSYEPGSDGRIVSALTNPQITTAELLPADWSPAVLLHRVATADPPFHALIDTGALITNMDNRDVAHYLMSVLPASQFDAVVYLDSSDKQVAVLRANRLTVPIGQCGVPLARRFVFFDQNHTTGTDVKQAPTAFAVVTIGKDMVFRDYAQGAYRMRGIGQGQRIHLCIPPEVAGRINYVLGDRHRTGQAEIDVPAWLLLNAMRIEGLQSVKLAQQEIANAMRKRCLMVLLQSTEHNGNDDAVSKWRAVMRFRDALESATDGDSVQDAPRPDAMDAHHAAERLRFSINEFREDILFTVPNRIEPPVAFFARLRQNVAARILSAEAATVPLTPETRQVISTVVARLSDSVSSSAENAEHQYGLSAEVVHEQEAEEEQEQEAEQEEQRVSAFTRDDEHPRQWPLTQLQFGVDHLATVPGESAFYTASTFRCRPQHRALSQLPRCLQISDNYFRVAWCGVGDRRLKNAVVFVEWITSNFSGTATRDADDDGSASTGESERVAPHRHFYGVVTLAEAETLRWLIHHSQSLHSSTAMGLRLLTTGNIMDATSLLALSCHTNHAQSIDAGCDWCNTDDWLAPCDAHIFFRFLNNEMFYDDAELVRLDTVVLRRVQDRQARSAFFDECLRLRRRHRYQWDDTPVARVLLPLDEDEIAVAPDATVLATAIGTAAVLTAETVNARAAMRRLRAILSGNDEKRRVVIERLQSADSMVGSASLSLPLISSVVSRVVRAVMPPTLVLSALTLALPRDPNCNDGGATLPWLQEHLFTAAEAARVPRQPTNDVTTHVDPTPAAAVAPNEPQEEEWRCPMCTGRNPWCVDRCDFCETPKPPKGATAADAAPWSCPACTLINEASSIYCSVCGHDSGRKPAGSNAPPPTISGEVPDGMWTCAVEKGGCSKFNSNNLFYCEVCDRARPDLATLRF